MNHIIHMRGQTGTSVPNHANTRYMPNRQYCQIEHLCKNFSFITDEPELVSAADQVLYVWSRDGQTSRHNITCIVDARPQPQIYWTRHQHHQQRQPQQQQTLQTNDTFHVFQLNSSVTVLQVHYVRVLLFIYAL